MSLDPALAAGLNAPFLRTFFACQIQMISTGTIVNVIDGSGFVRFDVDGQSTLFDGRDPIFGTIANMTSITEQVAQEAPTVTITMMTMSDDAFGEINAVRNQGSRVRIWYGLVNDMTGAVVGVPTLLWNGRLNTISSKIDENKQVAEIETVSAFDRLFNADEGQVLNKTWHQSIWPGETGLDFNVTSTVNRYWGNENIQT
jgi:hypothetical protein